MQTKELPIYIDPNSLYCEVGELEGITELVELFYRIMDTTPDAKTIRDMHADLNEAQEKLICFLSGWFGGPKLFAERYGAISLPKAHSHFPIDHDGKNSWLTCMEQAMIQLNYPDDLRDELMQRFEKPAESIRLMCE